MVAEPDKDMHQLYNLYLKNLGIREDNIIVAESGKKYIESLLVMLMLLLLK
ncbi:MAG: hypothetical protein M3P08_04915 [Thermoproteota archaeon]|nr:hypothetical protein [Thermoproteota archaeon]